MGAFMLSRIALLLAAFQGLAPLTRADEACADDDACLDFEEAPVNVELLQRSLEAVGGLAVALEGSAKAGGSLVADSNVTLAAHAIASPSFMDISASMNASSGRVGGSPVADSNVTLAAHANASPSFMEISASTNASLGRDGGPNFGDIVKKVGGVANKAKEAKESLANITSGLNTKVVDTLMDILNSTLVKLQSQADKFWAECLEYRDELLDSVQESSDEAITNLQTKVTKYVKPIQQLWSSLTGTLMASMPAISSALKAVGQADLATPVSDAIKQVTVSVNGVLDNATDIIEGLSNATRKEKDDALAKLKVILNKGMAVDHSFTTRFQGIMDAIITAIADKLGISLLQFADKELLQKLPVSMLEFVKVPASTKDKLSGLKDGVDDLVGTLSGGLDTVFNSTLKAASVALGAAQKDSAEAAPMPLLTLLLSAVCGAMSCY